MLDGSLGFCRAERAQMAENFHAVGRLDVIQIVRADDFLPFEIEVAAVGCVDVDELALRRSRHGEFRMPVENCPRFCRAFLLRADQLVHRLRQTLQRVFVSRFRAETEVFVDLPGNAAQAPDDALVQNQSDDSDEDGSADRADQSVEAHHFDGVPRVDVVA